MHRVLELEVYAAGVRDLDKILELDIELEPISGLRYKVDHNHDIVYMELDRPAVTLRENPGDLPETRTGPEIRLSNSAGASAKNKNAASRRLTSLDGH